MLVAGSCQITLAACALDTPPHDWPAGSARWDGECAGDKADGLGVLKEQQDTAVKQLFFGRVENGELAEGVIDVPEQGFVAGRFQQGRVLPDADRQTLINAFETAAQAAGAAAERFEHAGNAASAAFYRGKEKTLREQLD
jgi:hypothetical protein